MNKNKYTEIDVFRALDSAPQGELDETGRIKANARLQQILASDPDNVNAANGPLGKRRFRPARRVVAPIVLAAVAAITATVVLFPGADSNDAAYASWNAVPGSISSADRAVADAACLVRLNLASPQLDLAERRGEWVLLLYTGAEDMAGMCLAHLPAGDPDANDIDVSRGGRWRPGVPPSCRGIYPGEHCRVPGREFPWVPGSSRYCPDSRKCGGGRGRCNAHDPGWTIRRSYGSGRTIRRVVAGNGLWRRGGGERRARSGDFLHHHPEGQDCH